jgi:hypothetical protein
MTETISSLHVLPFAFYLAHGFACPRIIRVSLNSAGALVFRCFDVKESGDLPDRAAAPSQPVPIPSDLLRDSVIVCDSVIERLPQPETLLAEIAAWLDTALYVLLTIPDRDLVETSDRAESGRIQSCCAIGLRSIIGIRRMYPVRNRMCSVLVNICRLSNPRPGVSVAAIITAYNESDVLLVIDH